MAEVTTIQPQQTPRLLVAMLSGLAGAIPAGLLIGNKLQLYKSRSGPISPQMLLADFTISTFGGYTDHVIAAPDMSIGVNNPSGNGQAVLGSQTWIYDGSTAAETVQGYLITDTAGTHVYQAEDFATPQFMSHAGDFVALDWAVPLTGTPQFI